MKSNAILNRQVWLVAIGALGGMLGARMLARPVGREFAKAVLRRAFAAKDLLETELALLREDVTDVVAEAREEYRKERGEETPSEPSH
ncbi:MAG: hypothetical protein HYV09_30660 [Deltaproteobacteria bacterium]|nr:hypothetical protein [Deltaproteobacteria bacterium]